MLIRCFVTCRSGAVQNYNRLLFTLSLAELTKKLELLLGRPAHLYLLSWLLLFLNVLHNLKEVSNDARSDTCNVTVIKRDEMLLQAILIERFHEWSLIYPLFPSFAILSSNITESAGPAVDSEDTLGRFGPVSGESSHLPQPLRGCPDHLTWYAFYQSQSAHMPGLWHCNPAAWRVTWRPYAAFTPRERGCDILTHAWTKKE